MQRQHENNQRQPSQKPPQQQPCIGAGLGLRIPHIEYVLKNKPDIPWFEVHICNFLRGGLNQRLLKEVARHYPLSFHGVSLNLGGTDALDTDYLQRLKRMVDELNPMLISEHACFTALDGNHLHDLLPVPFTPAAITHFCDRIDQVQCFLGREILIENVSRYTTFKECVMSEADFLSEISHTTGCGILLDINNAYVNQQNLGESLDLFLAALPINNIAEIHLAGFSQQGTQLIDTHSSAVSEAVWNAYQQFTSRHPNIPCLIEWDNDLPDFLTLQQEQIKAQTIIDSVSKKALCGSA